MNNRRRRIERAIDEALTMLAAAVILAGVVAFAVYGVVPQI